MKLLLRKLISRLGYDLVPLKKRTSLEGVLQTAVQNGLQVKTIVDVGAGRGDFSRAAYRHIPAAAFILIEPLREFASQLELAGGDLPAARIVTAVASSTRGQKTLNVHPDLFGSSLLCECEATDVNGQPRQVDSVMLDDLMNDLGLEGPFLLKLDVQGAERDVLAGAEKMLPQADMVIMETSFFNFFQGGPLFHDQIAFMRERGFVLYDLFGLAYRPLDKALAQVDAVFVKENGALRVHHHYATPEQRLALTRRLTGQ
jgi:FkbM family methyltransferase